MTWTWQVDAETGRVLRVWSSVVAAHQALGIDRANITAVASGRRYCKTAGGFRWAFVADASRGMSPSMDGDDDDDSEEEEGNDDTREEEDNDENKEEGTQENKQDQIRKTDRKANGNTSRKTKQEDRQEDTPNSKLLRNGS